MSFIQFLILLTSVSLIIGYVYRINILLITGFSLFVISFFTWFGNSLPQFRTEPPEIIDASGGLSIDQMISIGKGKFEKVCKLCHNPALAGKAPEPSGLASRGEERLKDPNYKNSTANGTGGSATNIEEYVRESMKCPSCYVVSGFGVKGTNDMQSPMPEMHKPPTALSDLELDAVIAYLQTNDGLEVTVEPPAEAPEGGVAEEEKTAAPVIAATPKELIERLGCFACHAIGDFQAPAVPLGPNLTDVGSRQDEASIRQAILDPDAVVATGFMPGLMPKDYSTKMMVTEFEMLIKFLLDSKG